MMYAPHFLMIGAGGRNVGKTEFACHVIRNQAAQRLVFGVKITVIRENEGGGCPRGGQGCGVCGSLDRDFILTEETCNAGNKDTARMKAAGAAGVFWLRVRQVHIDKGLTALINAIPTGACVVCESNSARLALEPGTFLVIRAAGSEAIKASCAAVIAEADRILVFDGKGWDFSPERCSFEQGVWRVPALASAVVLAGGKSSRMGSDKALLIFRGKPLFCHILDQLAPLFDDVLVSAQDPEKYSFAGQRVVRDEQPNQGPLMGILSALQAATYDRLFVTACDIPLQPVLLIRSMLRKAAHADLVMPAGPEGRFEPLMAVYTRRLVPVIRAVIARGGRRMIDLFDEPEIKTVVVPLPETGGFGNLNTPEDYERALNP